LKQNWGKLLIIVLPIVFGIVLLYPSYRASQLAKIEKEYIQRARESASPADSLAVMDEFKRTHGEAYEAAKNNRLKLGLDLRGGMYVTMEADVLKLIEESAQRDAIDEVFLEVIQKTKDDLVVSDDAVIDVFLENFNDIAVRQGKRLINYFLVHDTGARTEEEINTSIIEKLREDADMAIDQAQEVIRRRIDQYGVSEPNIQKQGNRRIVLELPGVTNEEEMRGLLQTTARLEFHLLRNNKEAVEAFKKIDDLLARQASRAAGVEIPEPTDEAITADTTEASTEQDTTAEVTETTEQADTTAVDPLEELASADTSAEEKSEDEMIQEYFAKHPFTTLFATFYVPQDEGASVQQVSYDLASYPEGEYLFRIAGDSIPKFMEILNRPEVRAIIPIDIKITLDARPDQRLFSQTRQEVFDFYALKRDPELTGEVISDARQSFDPFTNAPTVTMQMNTDGAESWARITGANLKKRIAIVLDDRVYSAPTVQSKITGGNSQITGMSNQEEARLLQIVLKAGALKAPVQIIEERIVGPSLGADSIRSGVYSSLVAFFLVILYMFFYYNKAGLIADFAVMINVLIILSVLAALKGTLTLPGIAGVILTIGMAVDANVLIFERIREEIAKGRSIRSAIDEGFGKALSAIFDSNITTGITAIILLWLGSGPIQGFATTLLIGIISTLFTAIVVTRALLNTVVASGSQDFNFGQPKVIDAVK